MAYDATNDMLEIHGLLKFLAEKKSDLLISHDRLVQLIKHIAYGETGAPNGDHETLLSKLKADQVITAAESSNYVISNQILSSEKVSLGPEKVAGLLTKVFRWDECKNCHESTPEKDLVLIYLSLKEQHCKDGLSLIAKIEPAISLSHQEKLWLTEQNQVCQEWVKLASDKRSKLSP